MNMCPSFALVGPDGTGKTTLADALSTQLEAQGFVVTRGHYRPGVLDKSRPTDHGAPQTAGVDDEPPYGVVWSVCKLLVVYLDYLLAWCGPWRRAKKSGVLIVERGWFDQIVDPRRYRLAPQVAPLARLLGRFLPRFDFAVLLLGDADAIAARKSELTAEETRTQMVSWSRILDQAGVRTVAIDTVQTSTDLVVERVLRFAEVSDSEPVWRSISPTPPRLGLRATGGKEALPALAIYEPLRGRAKVALRIAESALGHGIGRRVPPPYSSDSGARETWQAGSGSVAMKSSYPNRWIVGVARAGRLEQVIKISGVRDERLENEAVMLHLLEGRQLHFSVPRLAFTRSRETSTEVCMLAADLGDPVTSLEAASAVALELSRGLPGIGPIVHGDLAPWNLREGRETVWLIDWEAGRLGFEPLYDLCHFVIRSGRMLDAWTPAEALQHLTADDGVGWRHLSALGEDPRSGPELVRAYLDSEDDRSAYADEVKALLA